MVKQSGYSGNALRRIPRATIMIRISFKTLSVGLIAFASMLAAPSAADASTLTYTGTGGIISGSLGETSFTDATWSVTGTGDPANVISGTYSIGPYAFPFNFLAMTPLLTITTGSSTLQATVVTTGSTGQQVGVFSADFDALASGYAATGFGYLEGDGSTINNSISLEGLGLYTNLQSPFSGSGGQNVSNDFNTSVGLFVMTDSTDQGATTFTVSGGSPSAVPEIDPNSIGSVLALVMGALGLLERRRLRHSAVTS
jgi:hypothetical protein